MAIIPHAGRSNHKIKRELSEIDFGILKVAINYTGGDFGQVSACAHL